MAANMVEQVISGTGQAWSEESLVAYLDQLNEKLPANSTGRVSSKKRRSTINLTIYMPASIVQEVRKHYQRYTWERSMLNETLLGEKFWRTGFKFKEAKGDWGKVFTVTEVVLLMMWEKMLREWETRYPKKDVRQVSISELQHHRPSKLVLDDPEMADLTVAQQNCFFACVYLHWVFPKAMESFGAKGCEALEKAKEDWEPWFTQDLRFVVLKKEQAATYDVLRLSDLEGIFAVLKNTAPGVSLETKVAQAATLSDEWDKYEAKFKEDEEAFKTAVAASIERGRNERLWDLTEFRKLTTKGESMVKSHSTF